MSSVKRLIKATVYAARNGLLRGVRSRRRFLVSRDQFLAILPKESVGAELGVFKGEFTRMILEVVRPSELHLIDVWWVAYGDRYPDWGAYTDHGRLTTRAAYDSTMAVVERYGSRCRTTVHVGDDLEYLAGLPAGRLDWAYIDSSHAYEHTLLELGLLDSRVKPGGLIAGHDWQEDPAHIHHGVCRAVREFCRGHSWEVILLDNHGQWAIRRRGV